MSETLDNVTLESFDVPAGWLRIESVTSCDPWRDLSALSVKGINAKQSKVTLNTHWVFYKYD